MYIVRYSNGGISLPTALDMDPRIVDRCHQSIEWWLKREYPDK